MEINKLVDLNSLRTAPFLSNSQIKKLLEEIETNAVHKHDKYQGMSEQFRLHEKNFLRDKVLGNFEHFAKPTDKDIDNAMRMNICRCGTYPRLKKAIKSAAKEIQNG